MEIRVATKNDAAGALAVYAQYINTSVTFEYELPSIDEFSRRISDTLKTHPYLVCMESGKLCGYAYAHQLKEREAYQWSKEREAYQWSAELSIYLDSGITSRGMGRTLYALPIEILKHQGVRTVYGCVTIPNPRSEKLHESLGFRQLGIFRNAGFKNKEWHDTAWFEKNIADCNATPAKLIPFSRLAPETVSRIIKSCISSANLP